jgi:hypothetical protein
VVFLLLLNRQPESLPGAQALRGHESVVARPLRDLGNFDRSGAALLSPLLPALEHHVRGLNT